MTLLAMSMVAMSVTAVGAAMFVVRAGTMQQAADNELLDRARQLTESGTLDADPAKAIEDTAYSGVNALFMALSRCRARGNWENP